MPSASSGGSTKTAGAAGPGPAATLTWSGAGAADSTGADWGSPTELGSPAGDGTSAGGLGAAVEAAERERRVGFPFASPIAPWPFSAAGAAEVTPVASRIWSMMSAFLVRLVVLSDMA